MHRLRRAPERFAASLPESRALRDVVAMIRESMVVHMSARAEAVSFSLRMHIDGAGQVSAEEA